MNFKSRLSSNIDPQDFLQKITDKQVPCPWGEVEQINTVIDPNFKVTFRDVPVGLVLGCGTGFYSAGAYAVIARAVGFGMLIHSDRNPPHERPDATNYIQLDLTVPETIHLVGNRIHAVLSCSVFTYDGLGVTFPTEESESEAAKRISDLLMPGGFVAGSNFGRTRFEKRLVENHGFRFVRNEYQSVIVQKPF